MDNMFYLLNIGVSGIKGIKNEVQLDFYKKTVDKKFDPEKYRIKAIYGENGSGKSALITAVKIFKDLCLQESYLLETKNQDFLREMINKSTHEFKFHCEYLVDLKPGREVFYYEIILGLNNRGNFEIKFETLKVRNGNYANSPYKIIFEACEGELVTIDGDKQEQELAVKKSLNLLSSRSFIHVAIMMFAEVQNAKVLGNASLYTLVFMGLPLYSEIYLDEEDQHELYLFKKQLRENSLSGTEVPANLKAIAQSEFSGVSEKIVGKEYFEEYQKRVDQLTQFIKVFKPALISIDIDKKVNGNAYECELNLNYGDYSINREFESTGIKKLIRLFDCFTAADKNGIVFIDEMDSNLNDVYLCKLLEYFKYYGKGQLCFTTHNLSPMTVLRDNKNSIDFLSSDNQLTSWTARGNATPENCYRNGMIENSPFNVDATSFIGMFGE